METAERREILLGAAIRVVTSPYFCATKIEAFEGRGKEDYPASQDLEDIIAVIDGRVELIAEIAQSADNIRSYIAAKISVWLNNDKFVDALPGHLGERGGERIKFTMDRLEQIANLSKKPEKIEIT